MVYIVMAVMACIVMAYVVMVYIVIAYIVIAYILSTYIDAVLAYLVMARVGMALIAMAHVAMARTAMALYSYCANMAPHVGQGNLYSGALGSIIVLGANMSPDVPPLPSASCTPHSPCLHTNTSAHMCMRAHTQLHAHRRPVHSGSAAGELRQPLGPEAFLSERLHRAGAYMPHHMHAHAHMCVLYESNTRVLPTFPRPKCLAVGRVLHAQPASRFGSVFALKWPGLAKTACYC